MAFVFSICCGFKTTSPQFETHLKHSKLKQGVSASFVLEYTKTGKEI
jgi:hypothetical protein